MGYSRASVAVVLVVALAGMVGCRRRPEGSAGSSAADRGPTVAGSILPIADVLAQLVGGRYRVMTLLPAGQTPHGYEPAPAQAERLAAAELLVMVGLGVDDWALRSAEALGRDGPRVLQLGAVVDTSLPETGAAPDGSTTRTARSPADVDGHDHGHHHAGADDPHIWLDPIKMIQITDEIARALAAVDPAGEADFVANAERFKRELRDLDRLYAERLAKLPRREFVTFHAAYGHLAARYGLEEVPLRFAHAEEAGPRQLEQVVAFIRKNKVRFIFAEPQFPVDQLDAIAQQTGVGVDRLDPLGAPGITGHDGYVAMMKTNLAALIEGLSR